MQERVLVVDDEEDLCRLLRFHLEQSGFIVDTAENAADALLAIGRKKPTVVILDVMLPDLSGVDVCRRIRQDASLSDLGILMLTALGEDDDRVSGLEAGADDYVVKPFNVKEVLLRVQALCRRIGERRQASASQRPSTEGTVLTWRTLRVDPRTHDSTVGGKPLNLRPLEFKLLVTLMGEPGRVFSRQELLRLVWDMDDASQNPRTVDVHVRRLRQNLGDCADVVETVPGFGYRGARDA